MGACGSDSAAVDPSSFFNANISAIPLTQVSLPHGKVSHVYLYESVFICVCVCTCE
jgi:hypothetical protein